jgi:hypothetical protein
MLISACCCIAAVKYRQAKRITGGYKSILVQRAGLLLWHSFDSGMQAAQFTGIKNTTISCKLTAAAKKGEESTGVVNGWAFRKGDNPHLG